MSVIKLTALSAVTANATSNLLWIGDFKRVAIRFSRDNNGAGGSSNFLVVGGLGQFPSDSPTMVAYNMLIDNVANATANGITRVGTKAIDNATTNVMLWLSPEAIPTHLQVAVQEGTDGTHSAEVYGYDC